MVHRDKAFLLPHSLALHLSVTLICRPGCRTPEQVNLYSLRKSGGTCLPPVSLTFLLTNRPDLSSPRSIQAGPSSLPVSCHQQTGGLWGPRTASKGAKGGKWSRTWVKAARCWAQAKGGAGDPGHTGSLERGKVETRAGAREGGLRGQPQP